MENWNNSSHSYDDIIDLPHHQSAVRPHMPLLDRAAQFSPFAALVGYEDAVRETARLTSEKIELGEDGAAELDARLRLLGETLEKAGRYGEKPVVEITYFVPDARKDGGAYETVTAAVRRIDLTERALVLEERDSHGRERIPIDDVLSLEGEIFQELLGT